MFKLIGHSTAFANAQGKHTSSVGLSATIFFFATHKNAITKKKDFRCNP
jgi:hypothetical protein